jgi:ferredoxin
MIIITLQRNKCIGCNYCAEVAPQKFVMSKKDGKSVLLHSVDKKGFFTLKETDDLQLEETENAAAVCPVKIITVKQL